MKTVKLIFGCIFLMLLACASNQVTKPYLRYQPPLYYPYEAQEKGLEGKVTLVLFISDSGTIDSVNLQSSSGHETLDAHALKYSQSVQFYPMKIGKKSVASERLWSMSYRLQDVDQKKIDYLKNISSLYSQIDKSETTLNTNRMKWLYQLVLYSHRQYAFNISNPLDYNSVVYYFLDDSITKQWDGVIQNVPLRFLVFHDYLSSGIEFHQELAKKYLSEMIQADINFIKVQGNNIPKIRNKQNQYLLKIYRFWNDYYPETIPKEMEKEVKDFIELSYLVTCLKSRMF